MATPKKNIDRSDTEVTKVIKQDQFTDPENLIQRLMEFDSSDAPFISLYLDARTDETGRRSFMPFVRKQLNERGKSYDIHSAERANFEEDFVRIIRYLEAQVAPASQGLAIFACSAANDYFEVGQFAAPFEPNRLFVSERPHIYPLARLHDQYRSFAVLLADTNRARIFVFAAGRTLEHQEATSLKTKHSQVGGWSQSRYQRHEENYHLKHAKEVVDTLERLVSEEQIENVILAGDEETVIPLLRREMSKVLAEKVVDVLSLGIDTSEQELLDESLRAFRAHDSLQDMEKMERLLNEYRADDLAVAGVPASLAALSNGQVEELLLSASTQSLRYDETEVRKVLDLYGGEQPPSLDQQSVADELVRRANQFSSARVTFIEDAKRLEQLGGVGALLRYRISAERAASYEHGDQVSRTEALQTRDETKGG